MGSHVTGGDVYGLVIENRLVKHKIIVPPRARGTVTYIAEPRSYGVEDVTHFEAEVEERKIKVSLIFKSNYVWDVRCEMI